MLPLFAIVARITCKGAGNVKPDQDLLGTIGSWIIYIVMAVLGCLANYASRVDSGEKFSIKTLALRIIVSVFAATLAGLWGDSAGWDRKFIFMACGLAGWMGVGAIKMIENVAKSRSGIDNKNTGS